MTGTQKLSNRLKQEWSKTNGLNWDVIESTLKSTKTKIDKGAIDSELIDTYIVISEAFSIEYGGHNHER